MSIAINNVKSFFDSPFYLEHSQFIRQNRLTIIRELLHGNLDRASILDLGCGDGSLSIPLIDQAEQLTLVDLSPRMLELAASRIPLQFRDKVTLINLPIGQFNIKEVYDIVICVGVLAHVPSIEEAMVKIAQSLKPGGVAVIEFTPHESFLMQVLYPYYWARKTLHYWKHPNDAPGYSTNKMSMTRLHQLIKNHGLDFKCEKRHLFSLPSMQWWSTDMLKAYTQFTMTNRLMSQIGTEHIMLFSKSS